MSKEITDLYTDFASCLFVIANELEKRGVMTKMELAEACQQRLYAMDSDSQKAARLLKMMAAPAKSRQD